MFLGISLSKWQKLRLSIAIISEGVGYLFVIWSAQLQYQNVTNSIDVPNIFGIWLGMIFGFFFLVVGILLAFSIKKNVPTKLYFWLNKPALTVSFVLLCLYLWLVLQAVV